MWQMTYRRQSSFHNLLRSAKFADLVQDLCQRSQRFEQNGHQPCALSTACCSHCYAEAFLWFSSSREDCCLEGKKVQGLREVSSGGEKRRNFAVSSGQIRVCRAHQKGDFENGDLVGQVRVGNLRQRDELGEVSLSGGKVGTTSTVSVCIRSQRRRGDSVVWKSRTCGWPEARQ